MRVRLAKAALVERVRQTQRSRRCELFGGAGDPQAQRQLAQERDLVLAVQLGQHLPALVHRLAGRSRAVELAQHRARLARLATARAFDRRSRFHSLSSSCASARRHCRRSCAAASRRARRARPARPSSISRCAPPAARARGHAHEPARRYSPITPRHFDSGQPRRSAISCIVELPLQCSRKSRSSGSGAPGSSARGMSKPHSCAPSPVRTSSEMRACSSSRYSTGMP
jgi:hypothetical protein